MVMWSIDCPPCYEELRLLAQYQKTNPQIKIIVVATDEDIYTQQVKKMLLESFPQSQNAWIFSVASAQKLRYSIDPSWYGELPRSYFFDQKHNRKAVSGLLTLKILETLLPTNKYLITLCLID